MSGSDDLDPLMRIIRIKLTKIMAAKGHPTDYNQLTPAVREHYRNLLEELVDEYFANGLRG